MKQSSRHIPCAVTFKKQSFLRLGGRRTKCACYFLNGFAFNSQPKAYFLALIVRLRLTVKRNAFGKVLKQQAVQRRDQAPRDHAMWRSMVPPELRIQLFQDAFLSESDDPWLDQEVIAACLALPAKRKRQGGDGKRVLKQLLSSDLPKGITHRRKAGFVIPLEAWMRSSWQPLVRFHLNERFAEETGLFRWPVLLKMMDDQRDGKADHAYSLYTLLILSIWWDTWITGRTLPICNRPINSQPVPITGQASTPLRNV